jgi:hypothetical protein
MEHAPEVERNCMKTNQWKIIGDELLTKSPIELKNHHTYEDASREVQEA